MTARRHAVRIVYETVTPSKTSYLYSGQMLICLSRTRSDFFCDDWYDCHQVLRLGRAISFEDFR